jgi:hypothetical protein
MHPTSQGHGQNWSNLNGHVEKPMDPLSLIILVETIILSQTWDAIFNKLKSLTCIEYDDMEVPARVASTWGARSWPLRREVSVSL